ncbi:MAG: hypothetical protein RIE32_05210 [Phycisphaerales bacterium]
MRRSIPVILILPVAAAVYMADPIRRQGPMLDPASVDVDAHVLQQDVAGWVRTETSQQMPLAFPPHNAVRIETIRYVIRSTPEGDIGLLDDDRRIIAEAFLRIVIAQDRRDLLAFDPIEAMRSGGWSGQAGEDTDELRRTVHQRGPGPFTESVTLDTAYVAPGAWGADPAVLNAAGDLDRGWPGQGAMVQLLIADAPSEQDAQALRNVVRSAAEALAEALAGSEAP